MHKDVLSPLLLHKSGTIIIYLLLSESHHHLTLSNVTSKLTTLPRDNILTT